MDLNQLLNIVVSRETAAITQDGFGTLLITGPNASFSGTRTYSGLPAVAVDFLSTTPEYKAAAFAFGQTPRPKTVKIWKPGLNVAQIETLTPDTTIQAPTHFIVTIDDVVYDFTSDGTPTPAEVVTGLIALINADPDVKMTASGTTTLILTAKNAGDPSVVSASSNLAIVHTTLNNSLGDEILRLILVDNDWYALAVTSRARWDVLSAAATIQALKKIYGTATNDSGAKDVTTTDIGFALKALGYDRTFWGYSAGQSGIPEAGWFGKVLPLPPGSETWAYKTVKGQIADALDDTEIANINGKNGNYYVTVGGQDITLLGKMASGEYIDVIRGIDALVSQMSTNIFGDLVRLDKIPLTDAGLAILELDVRAALEQFTGPNKLLVSYTVTVLPASQIPANDKANRNIPEGIITWTAQLGGAVHTASIGGTVVL